MSEARFFARSASDKSDNWPAWMVCDRKHGANNACPFGQVLMGREQAERAADVLNSNEAVRRAALRRGA